MLRADLHTHTIASGHGYSTVTENAQAAVAAGLELVATTDHGPRVPQGAHPWYFANQKMTPSIYRGVRLLNGCEANIVPDTENGLDLPDELLAVLDFVAVGFHGFCGFDDGDIDRNTAAALRAIANPYVDMLTHPGNHANYPLHLEPIVKAAAAHNVIVELNNHSFDPHGSRNGSHEREVEFAVAALGAGAPLAIGSDAHYHWSVGEHEPALSHAVSVGIDPSVFVNRSAETVLAHLCAKRPRLRIDWGPVVGG